VFALTNYGNILMENLLIQFLSLSNVVVYAITGAVAGGFGGALAYLLGRLFGSRSLTKVLSAFVIITAIQAPNFIIPALKKEVAATQAIEAIKKQRIFAALFRLHPEAEAEVKSKMDQVISASDTSAIEAKMEAYVREVVMNKYFTKHLVFASDASLSAMIRNERDIMVFLRSEPEVCVKFYLGNGSVRALPTNLFQKELDLKADVLESVGDNPSLPPQAAKVEDLVGVLAEGYRKKSYDLNNISKLGQVATLSADQGCLIATQFFDVIASLDASQSAYVFKNLIYLSANG
jgi:hypothetical protein